MGAQIDWQALPILVEIFAIDDIERLLCDLVSIRNFQLENNGRIRD